MWRIEAEDEVDTWLMKLSARDAAVHASTCNCSPNTAAPWPCRTRAASGTAYVELRFHLRDEQRRITFWIAPDRRIVLLTTFRKQRQNERREVERAHNVLTQVQQEFDR